MKDRYVVIMLYAVVFGFGCVVRWKFLSAITAKNNKNLRRLKTGMSKEEALIIMGMKTNRIEIMEAKGKNLEVLYYCTEAIRNVLIDDDELTPLLFEDGKLMGWGRSYLNGRKAAGGSE